MPKRIILLSDGTGNAVKNVWRTNVWRLFEALDLAQPDQIACYADGVGTSSFKPLAILGGVFGWGLKRNVLHLYKFLCRNHESDADIYAFGFSRGAFTIRVLAGLIAHQGIVPFKTESELDRYAKAAYRAYRAERYHSLIRIEKIGRLLRDGVIRLIDLVARRTPYSEIVKTPVESIRFVGVWDTVAAYGLPIDEMTRGVSLWLWPLELPDRKLLPIIDRACHALALDDERTTFHPVLWTEAGLTLPEPRADGFRHVSDERLSQVWFAGVHANVGGGYPDDSLAYIPLVWIMDEANVCGLRFKTPPSADPDALVHARSNRDKDGRLYDSRSGLGGYYRYGPRKLRELCNMRFSGDPDDAVRIELPKIHESAMQRSLTGAHPYAPIGIPARFALVNTQGQILENHQNTLESAAHAVRRADAQERIWNLVWGKRIVYFATLAASFHLALFPLFHQTERAAEYATPFRFLSETIRIAGGFMPGFFTWWLDAFATNPRTFAVGAALVAFLTWFGVNLGDRIRDEMGGYWRTGVANLPGRPDNFVYRLRNDAVYQWVVRVGKRYVLPLLSVVAIVYVCVTAVSHVAFNIQDAAGLYCEEHPAPTPVPILGEIEATARLQASHMCWASGILLEQGRRYQIVVTQTSPEWKDRQFVTDIGGFEISELPNFTDRAMMLLAVPMRRVFLRPWFRLIGRVGAVGADEYFMDPDRQASGQDPLRSYGVTMRPRRDGEFFLYVNDAASGIPAVGRWFYSNNTGEARVRITHVPR
jgi:uncharacterized protein (DUF2235 family)